MRFFCIAAKAYPYIDLLPPTMCGLTELKSTLGLSCNGIRTCLSPGSTLGMALYRVRSVYE
ncbi:hypothetical protein RERY_06430 [Rhodococcus erythropolis]|nr:hypothetical protein RERY_06430 [Rhodococcus erythropolis]